MLSPEARNQLREERRSYREWRAGNRDERFVLPRGNTGYDVCEVLLYPFWKHIGLAWRYYVSCLAGFFAISWFKVILYRIAGVKIGRNVYIAPGAVIDTFCPGLIVLEDNCFLGMGCHILAHAYTARDFRLGRVRIGKGSVIGAHATVLEGTVIGERCTVGANSLVNRNVPDNETVGGVPARPLVCRTGEA